MNTKFKKGQRVYVYNKFVKNPIVATFVREVSFDSKLYEVLGENGKEFLVLKKNVFVSKQEYYEKLYKRLRNDIIVIEKELEKFSEITQKIFSRLETLKELEEV